MTNTYHIRISSVNHSDTRMNTSSQEIFENKGDIMMNIH